MPDLELAFSADVEVGPILDLGAGPLGHRRIVPILGGSFEGPAIRGEVLPGSDWQVVRPDGTVDLVARYALRTADGALIAVVNRGLRRGSSTDPSQVYFRTMPSFETSAPQYRWLTESIFIGIGRRLEAAVQMEFWRLL